MVEQTGGVSNDRNFVNWLYAEGRITYQEYINQSTETPEAEER